MSKILQDIANPEVNMDAVRLEKLRKLPFIHQNQPTLG